MSCLANQTCASNLSLSSGDDHCVAALETVVVSAAVDTTLRLHRLGTNRCQPNLRNILHNPRRFIFGEGSQSGCAEVALGGDSKDDRSGGFVVWKLADNNGVVLTQREMETK